MIEEEGPVVPLQSPRKARVGGRNPQAQTAVAARKTHKRKHSGAPLKEEVGKKQDTGAKGKKVGPMNRPTRASTDANLSDGTWLTE